ncbi:MAG TPA: DUF4139 domain-containing protein [Polyangiaceae bacterium]|nr:DUF4139 domain-containing protein [Polyangiaceae bacterium]
MKTRRLKNVCLGLGALSLGALANSAAAAPTKKSSGAGDRKEVSITVYNQNFGLVREVRELNLGTGQVALAFKDVAAQIQPETVSIKAAGGGLSVLEQNYRFDLLTPQKLLEKHVGRKVRLHRYNERLGKEDSFDAELLSVADGAPVYKIGGEITYAFPGRVSFPGVPDNLMSKPTLVWLLDSKAPKQRVEVTYLTQNMTWKADYVFVINDKDTLGDLTGWVTLNNRSGASYESARLKLVAGDVQRVSGNMQRAARSAPMTASKSEDRFQEESFFEYHLYTLQQPTDVLENEQKQVTLLEAQNAKVRKKLIYYGQQYWYRSRYGEVQKNQKVGVYLDLENTKQNGLGIPLPKGIVRVYKADKSGAKQFIGEDSIDHTPRDERVRIKMGEAFDVVGDRKQMSWRAFGSCTSESEWEIELRNHKDSAEQVEVFEPIGGDWTVLESTHPHKKKDAFTFTFDVKVPSRGKTKIKYRVRVRWC